MIEDILEQLEQSNEAEILSFYNGEIVLKYDHKLHVRYYEENSQKFLISGATNVTGIVDKPALVPWAANMAVDYASRLIKPGVVYTEEELEAAFRDAKANYRAISRTATDIGHIVHEWLDNYQKLCMNHGYGASFEMPTMPEDPKAENCVRTCLSWMNKHSFHPIKVETQVFSRVYRYAGTYDHLAHITSCGDPVCCPFEGRILILGDFKSSKRIYDEYRMQTACYKAAHEEEFPDQVIDARVVIRLDKEGAGIETLTLMNDSFEDDFRGYLGALDTYNWQKALDLQHRYERAVAKEDKRIAKAADAALKQAAKELKAVSKPTRSRKKLLIKEVGIPVEV